MNGVGAVATWLVLLILLGLEFLLSGAPGLYFVPPAIGLVMAAVVALVFMRLAQMRGAAAIFATAGVFWLLTLLITGSLDPLTRHDIPVPMRTEP